MMVELTVIPVSQDEQVAKYVAEAIRVIDESGLDYKVTPMGTIIRGDWESVMEVVKACHQKVRSMTDRVLTRIYIDETKEGDSSFESRIQSVENILGKEVSK